MEVRNVKEIACLVYDKLNDKKLKYKIDKIIKVLCLDIYIVFGEFL